MTALGARLAEVQLALMLLTRLPAGVLPGPPPGIGQASWAFPLAGLAVGGVGAAVLGLALWSGLPPVVAAGLALAAMVLATGGLHEDGLADCADGFGGGRDPAARLEIMRDSRIGSYGALALILVTGLRWQALAALAALGAWQAALALLALAALSRAMMPVLMALMPPARPEGLGHAARARSSGAVAAVALGLALALVFIGPAAAFWAASAMALGSLLMAWAALRLIGGQTGDVLGATQQLAELAGLLTVLALVL